MVPWSSWVEEGNDADDNDDNDGGDPSTAFQNVNGILLALTTVP